MDFCSYVCDVMLSPWRRSSAPEEAWASISQRRPCLGLQDVDHGLVDLRRRDIEWLGLVRRGDGQAGALGRVLATGMLVQVNAGAVRTLDQRKAEAALEYAHRRLQDQVQSDA